MASGSQPAHSERAPLYFFGLSAALALPFLSFTLFGGYLFGPTDDLSDRKMVLEVPSNQTQSELSFCMTKDYGSRLHLLPAFSPESDPSVLRLYHLMTGAVVDLKDEGANRRVTLFAPVGKTLSDRQKAAVTDCAISTNKAFGAVFPAQD
jgi:hypothetical protein